MEKIAGAKSNKIFIDLFKNEYDFHYGLLLNYFGKEDIVEQWLTTKNPLLGYAEPLAFYIHRGEELLKFIESALSENKLEEK